MLNPIAIITLGCKLNQLESEGIADAFQKAGFSVTQNIKLPSPGIIIINTCTVTSKADQKCRRLIRMALRENPESCVIVTGCYAQLDSEEIAKIETEISQGIPGEQRLIIMNGSGGDFASGRDFAGTVKSALLDLPEFILKEFTQRRVEPSVRVAKDVIDEEEGRRIPSSFSALSASLRLCVNSFKKGSAEEGTFAFNPDDFTFHSRAYLKIQDGCDNSCAYCRVCFARGPSVSLPPDQALARLLALEKQGCAESMITGVNITQYCYPGFNLASLLKYLLDNSTSIALRLASLEPEGINEQLAAVLAHPRIRPHFHLSVQSGSDSVLRRMNRAYNSQAVEQAAALLRSVKENPFLACDIIAGFPAESETEFAETFSLCTKINFAWIHAFPYSPRPGTSAFTMKQPVCEHTVMERMQALAKLALQGRKDYARVWLGREVSAVTEKGPCNEGQCRAVSENYLKLIVNYTDECPATGAALRCTIESLCDEADGESPDAIAKRI